MTKHNNAGNKIGWLILLLFLLAGNLTNAQQNTTVKGLVLDAATRQPIPFASIYFRQGKGVSADSLGHFEISSVQDYNKLYFSYIGYQTLTLYIEKGKFNAVTAELLLDTKKDLGGVTVKSKRKIKYTNRGNPAVELIRRVIDNREKNRPQHYDYLSFDQYEKIQLSLTRPSNKVLKSKLLSRYSFLLDNTDTTTFPGKALTPVYLEEKLSSQYYRKDPKKKKTIVQGEKRVNFGEVIDSAGISAYLKRVYDEIDIYQGSISVFTNQFLSPISDLAPTFYMFFIRDTLTDAAGKKTVKMYFTPRNTNDFLFRGTMLISLDSTYAVQKVDMTVSPNINLNFIRSLHIRQEFEKNEGDGRYLLTRSEMMSEASLTKGQSGGLFGVRTFSNKNYRINEPREDRFFLGPEVVDSKGGNSYTDSFWAAGRHMPLNGTEARVYSNVDSLRNMKSFKRLLDWGTFLFAGYKSFGAFEVGPASTFYSFNPVEGFRLRFGGRTTPQFSKRLYLETYGAYGFGDARWKGFLSFTYSLNNKSVYSFPLSYIRFSAQRETKIPGQELQFVQEDNLLLSFKRGNNDKWLYNDIYRAEYVHEFASRFSYALGFKNWRQTPAGAIRYISQHDSQVVNVADLTTSEVSLQLRWAPNEQFYQGKIYRIPIINRYPIFTARYTRGIKDLFNGEYNYNKFDLTVQKRVYMSQFGFSDMMLEGSYTQGKVPYPLMSIHRANQTFAYQLNSYNLMNFLEFVSDRYVSLNVDHHFNGFIFNRIPLINRLNLREIVSAKVLFGGVRSENDPSFNNANIYKFPSDANGIASTYTLNNGPYIEGSVGIGNIFRLLRLDLVKRFTYLDHPNVAEWGIRGRMRFDF